MGNLGMDDLIGKTLRQYHVLEKVDQGGYAVVYKVRNTETDEIAVLKTVFMRKVKDPNAMERFEQEADIIAELDHHHIVPMYDHWHTEHSIFIIMQYMSGGSLRDAIKRNGAWSLQRTTILLEQITHALSAAHKAHIIHRDVKPANILLDDRYNAFLSDFGLAKRTRIDAKITETHTIIGSPAYQAPEQIIEEEAITPRTDVYALGITLFEVLTGKHPFLGKTGTLGLMAKQLRDPLPPVHTRNPRIPATINDVIQKATAKKPEARYPSVQALYDAFRDAVKAVQ